MVVRKFYGLILVSVVLVLTGCGLPFSKDIVATPTVTVVIPEHPLLYVQNERLWLSDATGGNATQLSGVAGSVSTPAWIDQTNILYTVAVGEGYETWLEDLTTRKTIHLTDWKAKPTFLAVAPNHAAVVVLVEQELYVVALANSQRIRIHEAVLNAAWSPSSQQIIFTTQDGRLLLQDIGLDFTLDSPLVLLEQTIAAPLFLDDHTIAFEAIWEEQYTLLTLDLVTQVITPLTSLRFNSTASSTTSLSLQPDGEQILYTRLDDATQELNIWTLHRIKDAPKLILTKAHYPLWSTDSDNIYYLIENELWRSTNNGFDKTKIADSVTAVATPVGGIHL